VVTDPAPRPRRSSKRRVTLGLAVLAAVAALLVGVVVGYVARGGPGSPAVVTLEQDLPVLTVTSPEEPAP
jgi:ABC-type Fe3+ transport system permease subunit